MASFTCYECKPPQTFDCDAPLTAWTKHHKEEHYRPSNVLDLAAYTKRGR